MSAKLEVMLGSIRLAGSRVERMEVVEGVGATTACELVFYRDAGSLGELDGLASAAADAVGLGVRLDEMLEAAVRVILTDAAGVHELFSGELVGAREEHLAHAASRFVIEARSLSHRWEQHRETRYYANHTLADVARQLGARLTGEVPPQRPALNYVQYDESAWSFLSRLADEEGMLLLSSLEGVEVRGGFAEVAHPLAWGTDLLSLTSHARPANSGMKGALYQQSEKRSHHFHGVRQTPATLGGAPVLVGAVGRSAARAAGGGDPGVVAYTSRTPTLADHRAALQRESARVLTGAVWVQGRSTRAALRAGERVEIREGEHWRLPTIGTFGVTEVVHRWDGQQYENGFRATPYTTYRAREAPAGNRMPGVVTALVTVNEDPERMGRVRVRYPWMAPEEQSGWVRSASVYAGNARGVGFLPEIGDEVLLGFEQGDAERPVVLGSVWNGGDKADHSPSVKQIQTRGGNTIKLEDAAGAEAVEIYSARGKCRIRLSTSEGGSPKLTIVSGGDLHLEAAGELRIDCQRYTQVVAGDAVRSVGGDDSTAVVGNVALASQGKVGIRAGTDTTVSAGANLATVAGATLTQKGAVVQTQPASPPSPPAAPARAPALQSAQQPRPVARPAPPRSSGDAPTPGGVARRAAAAPGAATGPKKEPLRVRRVSASVQQARVEDTVTFTADRFNDGDAAEKPQIRWAIRVGEAEPREVATRGERLQLQITREHDGKSVRAYAYRNSRSEDVAASVRVGSPSAWMPIAEAERNVTEIAGRGRHNPRVVEYHQTTDLRASDDETPWCSSFINWVMTRAGYQGTNSARAISWLNWGDSIVSPRAGAIVVIRKRAGGSDGATGSSSGNHVGFLVAATSTHVTLLGGNQGGGTKVTTSNYPLSRYRVLGYRWPRT